MEWIQPIIEVIKCFGPPTCTYIDHHRKFEEHMIELREKVDALKSREQDVESREQMALRCGQEVKKEVEDWHKEVRMVETDMGGIERKFDDVSYFLRGRLGKSIWRKIEEVEEIYQRGIFPNGMAVDGRPPIGLPLSTTNPEGQIDVRTRILEYLMGDGVPMIGVCGMGGIGKTTLMKRINDQLLNETEKFDIVIWITASKNLNIFKLQTDIAEFLKLQSLPDNELLRAARLKDYLEERRYVLILDDVWEQFSLLNVGIPDPTLSMGRKVVLTSRSADVCRRMDCEVVEVQGLSKNESKNLFLNTVGHSGGQYQNLEEIVDKVVEQCGGLPLSIVTIAGSMKGVNDICEWRNVLIELEERVKSVRRWDIEIYQLLKFSYDYLRDSQIQNCFLYCSLYPEDFVIRKVDLIENWIDEGLLDGLPTKEAMHHRGYSILNKLENNYLLERATVAYDEGVKMHDVLREMALFIAGPQFMVKACMQREEFPSEQEWTVSVEKVSLMQNSISEIPPHMSPKCPHLSTLILADCGFKRIPESFFKYMPGLKVLDLSKNYSLEYLPNSISNLKTLNALILFGCRRLKYVPSLVELTALRKLNLWYTGIEEVPHGIEMLENLRDLLMGSWVLKELPVGILPMNLQCLKIEGLFVKGEEVGQLRKLEWVSCSFGNMQEFKKYAGWTQGKWPTSFSFQVGPFVHRYIHFERRLNFKEIEKKVIFRDSEIEECDDRVVPHDLQSLTIEKCHDFKCLSHIPLFRKATDLKECEIWNCEGMKCVVDLSLSFCDALHNIEKLDLYDLPNLGEVVRVGVAGEIESTSPAPTPFAIFSSLKILIMSCCSRLKTLFPIKLLQSLQNLEKIVVRECKEMEEIIASEENHKGEGTTLVILPKLKSLALHHLPKLKSICSGGLMIPADSLRCLLIVRCPEVKRIPLFIPLVENGKPSPPPSLKKIIVDSRERWESVEWEQPDAKDVLSPFVRYYFVQNEMEKRCLIKCGGKNSIRRKSQRRRNNIYSDVQK